MYAPDSGFEAYQQTNTDARAASADPHELVIMLIDGFLDEIDRIEGHIKGNRFEHKGKSITKCINILGGLDSALDMEQGGEIAQNMHQLYEYCGQALFEISVSNEVEGLASIKRIMSNLREGWQNLLNNSKAA